VQRFVHPAARPTQVARACALMSALCAATAVQAAIVTLGDVAPDPSGGLVNGTLVVGQTGSGSVAVNGASTLQAQRVVLADRFGSVGTMTVTGSGSQLSVLGQLSGAFDIAGWGTGTLSVLDGANLTHVPDAACALCNVIVGNASGSRGQLTIGGAGSTFSTTRDLFVASTNVNTVAVNGFDYGTPGGLTRSEMRVENGGTFNARRAYIGFDQPDRPAQTGTEVSIGTLVVDGIHSVVNLVRNSLLGGGQSMLHAGHSGNGSGTVEVRNGGRIHIDGSVAPTQFVGATVGGGDGTSAGTLKVDGAGSRLHMQGGIGFLNIATSAASRGAIEVTGGGLVDGTGTSGLPFMDIGRFGGTGTALVSGADAAGNASTIRLAGRNPVTDGGAFLQIGRNLGGAGDGTLRVQAGGQVVIDTRLETLTNGDGLPGFHVGWGQGSVGRLEVGGTNPVNGNASAVTVLGSTGVSNWVAVGRDGATGDIVIGNGGRIVLESAHVSTPSPGGYASGDVQVVAIGRRIDSGTSASTGTVTVTGAGSRFTIGGEADSHFQLGFGTNASGTLNLLAGGSASANAMLLGNGTGGVGTLNMNAGVLTLSGVLRGGPAAGSGAAFAAGRSGGTGLLSLAGGSVIEISSDTAAPSFLLGGSLTGPGGTGLATLSGASRIQVTGDGARAVVGATAAPGLPSVGSLTLIGGSRLDVAGSQGQIVIGGSADATGTVVVGSGSAITASSLIGIAHDGSANTGGAGLLVVHGSAAAPTIVIGQQGLLAGNGTVTGNVINHGVVGPGNSPGRLTIDGALDSRDGRIVMEIEQQGDGSWLTDELLLADLVNSLIGSAQIEFHFLGLSDPNAFRDAELFTLQTFFKEVDANGEALPPSEALIGLFSNAGFSARSPAYEFRNFVFTADGGASFDAVPIPLPPSLALALLALGVMGWQARTRAGVVKAEALA